jgi:hypothetical protein
MDVPEQQSDAPTLRGGCVMDYSEFDIKKFYAPGAFGAASQAWDSMDPSTDDLAYYNAEKRRYGAMKAAGVLPSQPHP